MNAENQTKSTQASDPAVGSSDLLCVWKEQYPIMSELGHGWYLVAHPNGPAIARAANWQYIGHLGSMPGDDDPVPSAIKWRAVDALMTWVTKQPGYKTHNDKAKQQPPKTSLT